MNIIKTQDYQLIRADNFISIGIYELTFDEKNESVFSLEIKMPGAAENEQLGIFETSEEAVEVQNRLAKWLTDKYPEPVFQIPTNGFMSKNNPKLKTYYVHGKDNIPFHTTIYPAIILAIKNNYSLPNYIVSSAYVNLNNEKMSKSKGNLITANELLEMFDSDTLRFYFSFKGPETNDMNCSLTDIIQTHNKFLVGMLGNFVNRNLSFINKKFDGVIKEGCVDETIKNATEKTYRIIGDYFEKGEIRNAVSQIFEYVALANKYYDSKQPWVQVKEDIDGFNDTTYTCTYMIANMSNMITPILPHASKKIKEMLDLPEYKWEVTDIKGDYKIQDLQVLYDRIDEKKILNIDEEQIEQKKGRSR